MRWMAALEDSADCPNYLLLDRLTRLPGWFVYPASFLSVKIDCCRILISFNGPFSPGPFALLIQVLVSSKLKSPHQQKLLSPTESTAPETPRQ